ncbi:MAG: hypothetical protein HY735_09510 [Verrucomicrobia bacterium]|nr:hypothetical protein [Verrucomicrobiota bacterium]
MMLAVALFVAQIFILPYCRLAVGKAPAPAGVSELSEAEQIENLRSAYSDEASEQK